MEVKENVKATTWCNKLYNFLDAIIATIICAHLTRWGYFFLPAIVLILLLITKQWLVIKIYLFWLWRTDNQTPEKCGRRIQFICRLKIWQYLRNYFPVNVIQEAELDSQKNYLFCAYPHGTFPYGMVTLNILYEKNYDHIFRHHTPYLLTSKSFFYSPIYRDLILALGMCTSTRKSIRSILKPHDGGKVAIVMGGGMEEALNSHPDEYNIILSSCKEYIEMAIELGTPLVPVFSFGEVDVFKQVNNPKGSFIRRIQEFTIKVLNIAPLIIFNIIPKRVPINIVVGKPIEVEKDEYPDKEVVEKLQLQFKNQLVEMFENYKKTYLENSENIKLIIE
ncbi:hypothetical protein FQA39_LY12149 [Lamprigera yunnana]|nr:hypothetical protein FQA39_LY12149 [Lamprigera yunnana]